MSDSIRTQLADKIAAATATHPALQVITANGSDLSDILKGTLTTEQDVITLSLQSTADADDPNEDGTYPDGSPERKESYSLTYRLGTEMLSDDDAAALAQAITDYFKVRRNARIVHDDRTYTVTVQPTAVIPSPDMSFSLFEIPITVG